MPKQFVKLFNDKSLFQLTVERNSKFCNRNFIVSNIDQYFLAIDQLETLKSSKYQIPNSRFLLEPIGRNTAPAIALACMALDRDDIVLVTPSDHLIKDENEYAKVLAKAKELAQDNYLVTFGITPTSPEVGFGYIESNGLSVKAFHEKPDRKTAQIYLDEGNYYWNSGMFCFKAGVFLEELKKYAPKIYKTSEMAYHNAIGEPIKIKEEDMLAIPEDSIDYAVMEKSDIVKVIPSNIDWSEVLMHYTKSYQKRVMVIHKIVNI